MNVLKKLGNFILRLLRWYVEKVNESWLYEIRRLKKREKQNMWFWIGMCILFTVILFPILTREAFSDSFWLGLSFLWAGFLAISLAYILKNPYVMIIVYIGVILGRQVMPILNIAKNEVATGNVIGALIVFALGIYLIMWANQLKRGDIE